MNREEALRLTLISLLISVLLLAIVQQTFGSITDGQMEWNKTYKTTYTDIAYSLIQSKDGGYALAGTSGLDSWLVKTDSSGNKLWDRTYKGTGIEATYCVIQTIDGGYALVGSNDKGFWLIKTDSTGNKVWDKTYLGSNAEARSLIKTSDGGYALAGFTMPSSPIDYLARHFWLVKTDSDGNKVWDKTYHRTEWDRAYSIIQTNDGGYALAGVTDSGGSGQNSDFWLVKTDSIGNKMWDKTYGGEKSDGAYSVIQTNDKGYAIAGYTQSYGAGYMDFWLVKTDSVGNKIWDKTYGETASETASSLIGTSDGGYALAGWTASFGAGGMDFWLVKTDSAGNKLWDRTYGSIITEDCRAVIQTSDGGYALAGYSSNTTIDRTEANFDLGDFWLVKVPSEKTPTANNDYDGFWHTVDITVKLAATNISPNINSIFYRINNGSLKTVNVDGYPVMTNEGINKLEYWSIDNFGYEESPHIVAEIKLDKTPPIGSININNNEPSTTSTLVILSLNYSDATSNVAQVRYSNDGIWDTESWETPTITKQWNLTSNNGLKTVYYQIKDNAGLISSYSDTIILTINTIPEFQISLMIISFMITSTLVLMCRKKMKS